MGSELAKAGGGELATAAQAELVKDAVENPLRLLPADWRPVVWNFWAKVSDLLKTQLSLAATLRDWIAEDGLTLDDLRLSFAALNRPERRAAMRFPGDVLAELAVEVAKHTAARRKLAEQTARREKDEQDKAEAAPPEEIRAALSMLGDIAKGMRP